MHKMYSCLFVPNFSTVLASTAGSCRAALTARLAFPWHPQGTEGTSSTQHLNLYFQRDLQLQSGAWSPRRGERESARGTAHPILSLSRIPRGTAPCQAIASPNSQWHSPIPSPPRIPRASCGEQPLCSGFAIFHAAAIQTAPTLGKC